MDLPVGGVRHGVLLLADSEPWETEALAALRSSRTHLVVRRCLDVADLMSVAATGEATLALVAGDAVGLDAACVAHLAQHGVGVVAVVPVGAAGAWTPPRGTGAVLDADLGGLSAALARAEQRAGGDAAELGGGDDRARGAALGDVAGADGAGVVPAAEEPSGGGRGHAVVVWGPVGSPGRTTVSLALAGELAARGRTTVLVDLDPWGGTVAQHLGILSEVSGVLAAARAVAAGTLTPDRLDAACVGVGPHLRVLTGLPTADRWSEVGVGTVDVVLQAARALGDVVVDCGSGLDPASVGGWGAKPVREHLATEAVTAADLVVAVGAADPVGLARFVRAAGELADVRPEGADLVALNRLRPTLGWTSDEVVDLVARAVPDVPVARLPDDRPGLDRALAEGSLLTESAPGPLRATVRDLVDDLVLPMLGDRVADRQQEASSSRSGSRFSRRRGAAARRR